MSSQRPTLKRHNHRVHPCKDEKKEELLKFLLQKNSEKKIIVLSSQKLKLSIEEDNVSIVNDEELASKPDLRCELMISFDLPPKASTYMQRISHTDTYALILVNPSEEKIIHPIETLIGRTIMQEPIEGFSEIREDKTAQATKKDFELREERKQEFINRDEKIKKPRTDRPKKAYDNKEKFEKKPWENKERKENKYLGKDENGKATFFGKSGERNHRHDGTSKVKAPKLTGKKISIKGLKKKEK